jgi:hypothetical protein
VQFATHHVRESAANASIQVLVRLHRLFFQHTDQEGFMTKVILESTIPLHWLLIVRKK